ncbi:MAG: hypothetical protein LC747_03775, partial [Acidobacteria bacterium]|nr:hypothetical protein [Acidobacteriota bacterium]
PMLFVLVITLWALSKLVYGNLLASSGFDIKLINAIASAALIILATYLTITALVKLRGERKSSLVPENA